MLLRRFLTLATRSAGPGLAMSGAILLALGGTTASAQDVGDWDLVRDGDALSAVLVFEPSPTFIVRCAGRRLDVVITGLPAVPDDAVSRIVDMTWGDAPGITPPWAALMSTVAVSQTPDWMARTLRNGGALRMTTRPSLDAPGSRFQLDIPQSPSAIDTVLTACGMDLQDQRDAQMGWATLREELRNVEWERRPAPNYPLDAQQLHLREGFARLSCYANANGSLSDCRIESESTPGAGFGGAALASMRDARITPGSAAPLHGEDRRLLTFVVRFQMVGGG